MADEETWEPPSTTLTIGPVRRAYQRVGEVGEWEVGWREQASCTNAPNDLFFPTVGYKGESALALSICEDCPVKAPCLFDAIVNNEKWGVWGGTQRKRRERIMQGKEPAPDYLLDWLRGFGPTASTSEQRLWLRAFEEARVDALRSDEDDTGSGEDH